MILSPDQYPQASPQDLLRAAERGLAGVDQRWLRALLDRPDQSIPAILEFAQSDRPGDRESLREDLLAIFRHLRDPRSLPFLVEKARQTEDLTLEIIDTFRSIGPPSVDALLPLYEETKNDLHCEIAFLLSSLGLRDSRILQVLTDRLRIDPVDAGHCLAAYGDPAGVPALEDLLAATSDPLIRGPLEQALERLRKGEPDAADEPFDIWAHFPAESDPHFEWMDKEEYRPFLDSSEGKYRAAAIARADDDGLSKRDHDLMFRMAREDPDAMVRGRAWQALSDAWDRPDIRDAMRGRIADEAAPVEERCGVLVALSAREGDQPAVQKWILGFYERPESRAAALRAMSLCGDPRFEKYFPQHLGDEDVHVQLQAIQGVGLLEIASAAPALAALFEDDDLRQDALMAYALAADAPLTRRGIRQLIEKIDRIAGLSEEEEDSVKSAVNYRLERNELPPMFDETGDWVEEEVAKAPVKAGRNDPCPCGSGKKYKKCCGT